MAVPTWLGQQRGRGPPRHRRVNGALNDIGYTLPGQHWTYWNKGPGPGEEVWLSTEDREWTIHRRGVRVQPAGRRAGAAGVAGTPASG